MHEQRRADLGDDLVALDMDAPSQARQRGDRVEQVAVETPLVDPEASGEPPQDDGGEVVALEVGVERLELRLDEGHAAASSSEVTTWTTSLHA